MTPSRALAWLLGISLFAPCAWAADGDVTMLRQHEGDDPPRAVFPHWTHRIRYTCAVCHPDPFAMKAGSSHVTMDAIAEGKLCGRCHNGAIAWGVDIDTCNRCHIGSSP